MSIRLISGRVQTVPPLSVNGDRYSFIALNQAEPNLGVPYSPSQEENFGWVLTTNLTGGRNWYNAVKWDSTYSTVNYYSGGWESTYNTVSGLSAYWLTIPQADAFYFKVSGGTIGGDVILNNLTVQGTLTVLGGVSSVVTKFNINSSVSAINYDPGPAIYAWQKAFEPNETIVLAMAEDYTPVFYASQQNVGFFTQDNSIGPFGVTVNGNLSAKGTFTVRDIVANTLLINGFSAQDIAIVFTKAISALDGMVIRGHSQLESVEVTEQLYVSGATNISNNVSVGGTLGVGGSIIGYSGATINGDFDVANGTYLSGGLSLESLFANNDDVRKGLNAYANLSANSGNWDSTYFTVSALSAYWNDVYNAVASNSASWNDVYVKFSSNSGRYDSVYSTTNANSADWGGITSTIPYLSTTNVLLSSASVLDLLSARSTFISNILPVTASYSVLPINGNEILIQGNYLYTVGSGNINIVDVTNSLSAKSISNIPVGAGTCAGSLQSQILYVASANLSLYTVDVSNPTLPVITSQAPLISSTPTKVHTQGRYVYIAESGQSLDGSTGILEVLDISNPLLVTSVAATSTIERIYDFVIQGNYIYTVSRNDAQTSVDVTSYTFDGNNLTQIGNFNIAATVDNVILAVQGNYLYLISSTLPTTLTVTVLDISNPSNLKLQKLNNTLNSISFNHPVTNINVKLVENYLYITTDNSLLILNISNLNNVFVERRVNLFESVLDINAQDRSIYTIDNNGLLTIYNVGGSYIQQLEAGIAGVGELTVKQNAVIINNINVGGAATFTKGFNSNENSSVNGSLNVTETTIAGLLSTSGGTSNNWNSVYTNVNENSGRYESNYTTTSTLSDRWGNVYTSFNDLSGRYESVYTNVNENSGRYESNYTTTNLLSDFWSSGYSSFNELSSRYESVYITVDDLSGYWNDVYNAFATNSANLIGAQTVVENASGLWNSVYTSVLESSAGWNATYIPLNTLSAGWQSTYATMTAFSASWVTLDFANGNYVPLTGSPFQSQPTGLRGNYFIDGSLVVTSLLSAGTTFVNNVCALNNIVFGGWLSGSNNPWVSFNRASAGNPTNIFGGWNFAANAGQSFRSPAFGFAVNDNAQATASGAFASGQFSIAGGDYSFAANSFSYASTSAATTFGAFTSALGVASFAKGWRTRAQGNYSLAEGLGTLAVGDGSHAEGLNTFAWGNLAHAEGNRTVARGLLSHAEGLSSVAVGIAAHSHGQSTSALGDFSFAGGSFSIGTGTNTVAFGVSSYALGDAATSLGYATSALGIASFATGYRTVARAPYGSTFGIQTSALGIASHAEGFFSVASGDFSHAEGFFTVASGFATHTEGIQTTAWGQASHAEGRETIAFAPFSHTEGLVTSAFGVASHAEGVGANSRNIGTHAEGFYTSAFGDYAHAEGHRSRATGFGSHSEGWGGNAIGIGSHVEGYFSIASGDFSHAEGFFTVASGYSTHTEGIRTTAWGTGSHAEGNLTISYGINSHAEGDRTFAFGESSHAEGLSSVAIGRISHAEGLGSTARGIASHAEGNSVAIGDFAHAEGERTFALGFASHTEGRSTSAIGNASHAEGWSVSAIGIASHAEGFFTIASGDYAHAEGFFTVASGRSTHTEGAFTTAWGTNSHAEGNLTVSFGVNSHAEGDRTFAFGEASHVEGLSSFSFGRVSHAEGWGSTARGIASHSEGNTVAVGDFSHAEGERTFAFGLASHTEGRSTSATGIGSHAEGEQSIARGDFSHAQNRSFAFGSYSTSEGLDTSATGFGSHAEGRATIALGNFSHTEGDRTFARNELTHTEGYLTSAFGVGSHAEGLSSIALGNFSHSQNVATSAYGLGSHAEGGFTLADTAYGHAEGFNSLLSLPSPINVGSTFVSPSGNDLMPFGNNSWRTIGTNGTITVSNNGRNLAKSGGANQWDVTSFIPVPLQGSWFIKYRRPAGANVMIGISRYPGRNNVNLTNYADIDSASYTSSTATFYVWDLGVQQSPTITLPNNYQTTNGGYWFLITYDGLFVRHWYNTNGDNIWNFLGSTSRPLSSQNSFPGYPTIAWWGNDSAQVTDFSFGHLPIASHTEGYYNRAPGAAAHAQGMFTVAAGEASHSHGVATSAIGVASVAGGLWSVARGTGAVSYGLGASAFGDYSYAFGTSAAAYAAHNNSFIVVADNTINRVGTTTRSEQIMLSAAGGVYIPGKLGIGVDPFTQDTIFSIAGGISAQSLQIVRLSAAFIDVDPIGARAFGSSGFTTFTGRISAKDSASFNQGVAIGVNSFAEGRNSFATGDNSHAEGLNTTAAGQASHAEGQGTNVFAGAQAGHAEGINTVVEGSFGHAEGSGTIARGNASHAEGQITIATGLAAHAEGRNTVAFGNFSHAAGSFARAHHPQSFLYHTGDATTTAIVSTTNAYQFVVSAVDGIYFPGFVGIGINPLSAGDNWTGGTPSERYGLGRLTTTGMISTNALIRTRDAAITRTLTATNIEASPRYNDVFPLYGTTNRPFTTIAATPITILGSISGFGNTTSFNHGSAGVTTLYSFAANGGRALNDYAFATGLETRARGIGARAGGLRTIAQGDYSFTTGQLASAIGTESFVTGRLNLATSDQGAVFGRNNRAMNEQGFATGRDTLAFNQQSFTQGNLTSAYGVGAAAFGYATQAWGDYGATFGYGTSALAFASHAEGFLSRTGPGALYSHAEGFYTSAQGIASHTEGAFTSAFGYAAHAEGYLSLAYGLYSHAEGHGTRAMQQWSHTEGYLTSATLVNAEDGINTVGGHAEGAATIAAANWAHAEGNSTIAAGRRAHSEGYLTYARGYDSHTEGQSTSALGLGAHAEGYFGLAQNDYSHAEGWAGLARGDAAHTEGWGTSAMGHFSHAEGYFTTASAQAAHAEGYQTIAGPASARRIAGTGFIGNEVFPQNTVSYWLTAGPATTGITIQDKGRAISSTNSTGWDSIAWIPIPFYRSGYISFNPGSVAIGNYYMIGFTTDPRPDAPTYDNQAFSWYVLAGTGAAVSLGIYEGASNPVNLGTGYTTATQLAIVWDLNNIYYVINGSIQRTVARPWQTNGPLFARIAFYGDVTNRINVVRNLSIGTIPAYTGHAEGIWTAARADAAHAEGLQTVAQGDFSHTEGFLTSAFSFGGHAEGIRTTAVREATHAEGFNTIAFGQYSHAQNLSSVAIGDWSHAEGWATQAEGQASHTQGRKTTVTPFASFAHAEGAFATASGVAAHAEGWAVSAVGFASHAQGLSSYAFGVASHTQNYLTSAYGNYSTAIGHGTQARGAGTIAAGISANALHDYSFIWVGDVNVRNAPATNRSEQFVVSARQGMFIPGYVGVGIDPFNTATIPAGPFYTPQLPILTVRGLLSSTDTLVTQITASDLTIINRISASRFAKYEGDGSLLHSVTATNGSVSWAKLRYDTINSAPFVFNINNNDELLINQASTSLIAPVKTRVQHLTGGMVRSPLAAKAFVYFTVAGATPTIQYSYNVESITYVSTGRYYVRFTNPGYINFQSVVLVNAMYDINALTFFTNRGVTVNGYMDQANSTPYQATVTVKTPDNTDVEAEAVYLAIY